MADIAEPIRRASHAGVRIAGTGAYLPEKVLTNADLERLMDTSDEWIVQRTGVRERRICEDGDSLAGISAAALKSALKSAGLKPSDLDLLIVGSVSSDMTCPSAACQVLDMLAGDPEMDRGSAGAFDLTAACCGFVYGLNVAHEMIRGGAYKTVGVVGSEILSRFQQYDTAGRGTAIIFGDGAGAAILRATDDPSKGQLAQAMYSDGTRWKDLFIPNHEPRDFPGGTRATEDVLPLGYMRMNGRAVFRFAVGTFGDLIQETLDKAGVTAQDVSLFVCHQSNVRILDAARDRFGIPPERMPVNIDRLGNTSAASVPLLYNELVQSGRAREGELVMFVAFGAGLTWTSSLWRI
ncbi:MAG: beta-ketoacyl-ACP synthase III [Planctomycetota bacterium]